MEWERFSLILNVAHVQIALKSKTAHPQPNSNTPAMFGVNLTNSFGTIWGDRHIWTEMCLVDCTHFQILNYQRVCMLMHPCHCTFFYFFPLLCTISQYRQKSFFLSFFKTSFYIRKNFPFE